MTLEYFQIHNCFGFKDSGKVYFNNSSLPYTILGKNSSGKTSLINAIEAFEIGINLSNIPRFRNFDYGKSDGDIFFKAKFRISENDFKKGEVIEKISKIFFEEFGLAKHELENISGLKEIYENLVLNYSELVDIAHKYSHIVVEKHEQSNYIFYIEEDNNSKNKAIERTDKIVIQLDEILKHFPNPDPNKQEIRRVNRGGGKGDKDVDLDFVYKMESELFYLFPKIYKFSNEYSLEDNLPDVITEEIINSDEKKIISKFNDLLGKQDLIDYFEREDSEAQESIINKIQRKLDNFAKNVIQLGENVHFLKFKAYPNKNGGIQITVKIDTKLAVPYNLLSENTKFLIAYCLFAYKKGEIATSDSIVLFDEPDKGFHSSAQKELLRFLKDLAKKNLVIFSTHSEYLIDNDNLEGIKIMERGDNQRLVVKNNWWKANASKGDLLAIKPITNAIGLKFGQNLLNKNQVVVLEEISAMFYLKAFEKLLEVDNRISFFPMTGEHTIINIIPFLISQGIQFKIALDYTKPKNNTPKSRLQKQYYVNDKFILDIGLKFSDQFDTIGIEDLFSDGDFNKFVLEKGGIMNNSNAVKGKNKGELSLQFYQKVKNNEINKDELEKETLDNFQEVIEFCINDAWFSFYSPK